MTRNDPFQASPKPLDFLGKTPVFGPQKAEKPLQIGRFCPLTPRKGKEMNADELILAMAREKARTFAIDLRTATVMVLEDPQNVILAESYAGGGSPSMRERQTVHLAAAMGRPVAAGGININIALAQAATQLVASGQCRTHSAAIQHLLADPSVARAYENDADVIGVAGAEIRLSPFSPTPAGPRIACLPQHRHVTTGMAA